MLRVVAVASGKGGVGKTAVAVHLAAGLAAAGKRVLLVDLDPGGHASTRLLGDRADVGIAEAMIAGQLAPELVLSVMERRGLYISPASQALRTVGARLADKVAREKILREIIRGKRKPQFDVVVIDSPPGVDFLPQSAVFAADHVIIPVTPGFDGISGARDAQQLVSEVQKRGKVHVSILGCVLFQADDRELVTMQTREWIQQLGLRLCTGEVRVSTAGKRLSETKALAFDPGADARGLVDYQALLKDMEARL